MGLIACGGSDGSANAKNEIKSVLTAEITGDINESYIASRPITQCSFDVLDILDMAFTAKTSFELSIPMKLLHQGEYPLIGTSDTYTFNKESKSVRIAYDASNDKRYGKNVKGIISLTNVPKKIGEHLIGHLKATAQIESNGIEKRIININMQFDIVANESTFHLCE